MQAEELEALIPELFAPWVQQLPIAIVSLDDSGARFELAASTDLARGGGTGGGVVCGQALSAAADTLSVLTLIHVNGRFRACTTTDLNVRFMRPVPLGPIEVVVAALSNGRRMAVTQAEIRQIGEPRLCATATATFAYLEA